MSNCNSTKQIRSGLLIWLYAAILPELSANLRCIILQNTILRLRTISRIILRSRRSWRTLLGARLWSTNKSLWKKTTSRSWSSPSRCWRYSYHRNSSNDAFCGQLGCFCIIRRSNDGFLKQLGLRAGSDISSIHDVHKLHFWKCWHHHGCRHGLVST